MKVKKYIRRIILILMLLVFITISCIGIYIGSMVYNQVCEIKFNKSNSVSYNNFKSTFDYERFNLLDKSDVTIQSNFGYKLSGTYIRNFVRTKNTIIIVHGITGSRWESMKYADMYIDLGYNVLIYDSRYHGTSGGNNISLGYFEKYDLDNCVRWVRKQNPNGIIGIHGESMGAATALLHSNMNIKEKYVSFYIVDCPFSDLPELFSDKLTEEMKNHGKIIANAIVFYSSVYAWYKAGFSLYSISPKKALDGVEVPIMFIHGADDDFIPPYMSLELYIEKKGPKYLYIAPNAGHAQSYLKNKDEYKAKVREFLMRNKIIDDKTDESKPVEMY
ncbi:alpha/beta hydrolase [Clostridium guangxiense]|uniref:alpha/beta hydrolase n=1 Tax=Clostridium guangxiense TaxID=1662055 RepID=UPI001E2D6AC9|nr:alpha/beta hydrolase [Clostridium guangxiense]MCD2347696.1 alpha/beta hydrolase [Clostridium guangxiense]